ncbi:hypothetical protein CDO73_00900 [Saccharibacillus sp. O23]|uniref:DUF5704 domain-containing protein n=1 Tax=Saccharibacillus sp. O23 TaxID=2009338 RepID=UPI000B4E3C8C|nr:DUF5704 domain-containing protein [Saccharibacillus sp. O23]OWR33098.1 hypothetical protein CDO73_00900 [Saccharibacillus sp. O23]
MKKTYRQRFTIVGLTMLLLIGSIVGVFFPAPGHIEAAPAKKEIEYESLSGAKAHPDKAALKFGPKPTAKTKTINEDAGTGKKIQKIVFYRGIEAVKTIEVNAQTYTGSETFGGEAFEVKSVENGSAGSWFAWQRGETTNPQWFAGNEGLTWERRGSPLPESQVGTEPINGKNYREFPGQEVLMTVKYGRTKPFISRVDGIDLQFRNDMIDTRSETIDRLNQEIPDGVNVKTLRNEDVEIESLGIVGKSDPNADAERIWAGREPRQTSGTTRSLDFAYITFSQTHNSNGKKYYVREHDNDPMVTYGSNGPRAQAMMFYFAAYNYTFKSQTFQYPDHYWVYTEDSGGSETEEPIEGCTIRNGRTMEGQKMTPESSAVIKADQRGSEMFDVLLGIPTSESLYGNVLANSYLHQYKYQEKLTTCVYEFTVTKTYNLTWFKEVPTKLPDGKPGPPDRVEQHDTKVVPYPIHIERYGSHWVVDKLGVYSVNQAVLQNYAFSGDQITITPSGYTPPNVSLTRKGKSVGAKGPGNWEESEDLTGNLSPPAIPNELDRYAAEGESKIGQVKVNNDKLTFNGQVLMDDAVIEKKTQEPKAVPDPQKISQDVLYSPNHTIPIIKTNRQSAASMGTITYTPLSANYNAVPGDTYPIGGINSVTVHTPVVNYSSATDDQAHNQKTTPNASRAAFILDRPFTIRIPTSGQHANYPGYGDRDYQKYFRAKQVRFPFDTYTADRSTFYPSQTWIDIPVSRLDTTFFLPVWVDEGDYTVEFRNIAENAPDVQPGQPDANLDLTYHVASDTVGVEVIGRLYDFHLTDIVDYNWELVFREQKGSPVHTGNTYWTGLSDLDGAPRGNASPFTLPILPGSNPLQGMKNVSVKTGYHVKFDLKTKGNMFGKTDGIRITPSFTFVSKDGKTKTPVDLYYHDDHRSFIQVGSEEDTVERYVILNERLRNVPEEELTDTARYKYDHDYTFAEVGGVSREMFVQDYIRRFTKLKTPVGGYDLLLLPEQVRTLIGPKTDLPASVDYSRANAAVQKWYGEYNLPVDPYVVAQGTNLAEYGRTHRGLTKRDPIFLRDGYIILNFNIESIRGGDLKRPHLQYMNAPLMNQWTLEGYKRSVKDSWGNSFNLRDGDIVFYNGDKSYKDDFQAQVPH